MLAQTRYRVAGPAPCSTSRRAPSGPATADARKAVTAAAHDPRRPRQRRRADRYHADQWTFSTADDDSATGPLPRRPSGLYDAATGGSQILEPEDLTTDVAAPDDGQTVQLTSVVFNP